MSIYTGYTHLSSGEALRKEIMSESSRGLALYNAMYDGEPLPNKIMTGVIRETMFSKILQKGFNVKVG
jgi:adenylate kinase family enzyme